MIDTIIKMVETSICFNHLFLWCLCPTWMGWMPWLVDGDEVLQVQGKTIERNRTSRHNQAGLKGL